MPTSLSYPVFFPLTLSPSLLVCPFAQNQEDFIQKYFKKSYTLLTQKKKFSVFGCVHLTQLLVKCQENSGEVSIVLQEIDENMPNLVSWTREEEKAFENGIATHMCEEFSEEEWEKIASLVPTKSVEQIRQHYQVLVDDVNAIEAGKVTLPNYGNGNGNGNEEALLLSSSSKENHAPFSKEHKGNSNQGNGFAGFGASSMGNSTKASKLDQERKKGIPWTEEEHRLFLLGLDKFGKGDWRSISRNFVITRTPTQVASHAQKYFIRLNSMNRDRRRSSIHDITSVNGGGLASNQAPITGQQNTAPTQAVGGAVAVAAANKHRGQANVNVAPGIGMYGTQIGHPVTASPVSPVPPHMGSAVGTPVMLPPPGHHPHHHHPPHYAVPMAYPMAPPPMHR